MHPEQQRALDYLHQKGTLAAADHLRKRTSEAFAVAEAAFDAVPAERRERSPAPGKWSPHEILDHLVLSHGPAVPQLESVLRGDDPAGDAIPANLHRDERPPWEELRAELGRIHAAFLALLAPVSDDRPLTGRAPLVMVVKVDGQPVEWEERLDWKAFVLVFRLHTLEHQAQLERTLAA